MKRHGPDRVPMFAGFVPTWHDGSNIQNRAPTNGDSIKMMALVSLGLHSGHWFLRKITTYNANLLKRIDRCQGRKKRIRRRFSRHEIIPTKSNIERQPYLAQPIFFKRKIFRRQRTGYYKPYGEIGRYYKGSPVRQSISQEALLCSHFHLGILDNENHLLHPERDGTISPKICLNQWMPRFPLKFVPANVENIVQRKLE